jgi:surfactin synthase thioesterase subunit
LRISSAGGFARVTSTSIARSPDALPGGHFFIDQLPQDMARVLSAFLKG